MFAPAERKCSERVCAEHLLFAGSDIASPVLNALTEPTAVLNEERQLVYANAAFLEFADIDSNENLLGLRLGELFGCVHAVEDVAGCGTHRSCKTCGTVNAALGALAGKACVTEVDIAVVDGDGEGRMRFQLTASPITLRGKLFLLIRIEPL